jgi:hypothetical protein
MIRETELFVKAEQMLVEVVGRIRAEHWRITIPPQYDMPGADQPTTVRKLVNHIAFEDAWVPDMLAGRTMEETGADKFDGNLLADDPHGNFARLAETACAAAGEVTDGDAVVHCSFGDVSTREYLWQVNIARCFTAHDIAMALGSRACPLPEDLARGVWEGTEPDAQRWRERGIFREPLVPVPADVSWRDRFLMAAGRDPHPFLHD